MKIKQLSDIRRIWKPVAVLTLAFCMLSGIGAGRADASSCIAIDDVPLDTQEQQAPGIVMFVIDDSGSMDWEYICQGSGDGKFEDNIEYLFANPGDNVYGSGDSNGTILEGSASANKWRSQWAGHNRLYYDPEATYAPWPTYSNADPNNPRSNPAVSGNTLNLSAVFSFVPTRIIDNTDTGFSRTGALSTWTTDTTASADYGSNNFYTSTSGNTATWNFTTDLATGGLYDVAAWWGWASNNSSSYSSSVQYTVNGVNAPTVSQKVNSGRWNVIRNNVTFSNPFPVRLMVSSTSRHCADAMALGVAIPRAHYYTKNATGTYLVNIDGGTIVYYKFTDANNDTIVTGNELQRLTTAEATTAGIVTGRTYTQERQNFANWYSFYRRRELTAKNAVANVINDMHGVYIGVHCINSGLRSIAKPVRVMLNNVLQDQSGTLLTTVYNINSSGSTPLRIGLKNTGEYFRGAYGKPSPLPSTEFAGNTYPFFTADKGGACQQAFAILMTDGYWNDSYSGVGNADKNDSGTQIDGFDGPPFADNFSDTLADVAMHYYEHDLNATLNNDVPTNTKDKAEHQHLVTYTLSFGLHGSIDQTLYPDCPTGACPPWPQPVANTNTTIDDMWHAAINGRGKYVNAASPGEMVTAMNELKQDIESRLGSAAAMATSSIQRQVGTMIYQGTYNTAGWFGEVAALPVNVETGTLGAPIWRASENIPAWVSRNILSYDGSGGIIFTFNNISAAQETLLQNNGHNPAHLVDFIRGDKSRNTSNGGSFRVRTQPIGDIVHSAPTYYKGMVYIGSNDGMLHAIDAATGAEKFCYVPGMVYGHLSYLALPAYSHRYYVDSTPTIGRVNNKDILICGLGKGGKGYFALDVTDPNNMTAGDVLWEYAGDTDLGYSFSDAKIVNTEAGRVVVFGNGYDSVSQKAVLFLLDPETGAVVRKLDTLAAGCNGLSTPKVADVDGDGHADFAFAGDLKGNMWKFDLRGPSADWKVYYTTGSLPQPLISVRNANGNIQPITTAPEVMLDCAKSGFANTGKGLMIIFGTGRYLNSDDFNDFTTQSFYGIWDWGDIWEKKPGGYNAAKTKFLGVVQNNRTLSNIPGPSLQAQTVTSSSGDWLTLSNNPLKWYNPDANTGNHMGWVFDLPVSGERGVREPSLRMGAAVMVSITPSSSPCEAGGSSVFYQVSACSGGRTDDPIFDVNGDGKIDDQDLIDGLPPTGYKFDQMLFEPIEIGDRLYFPNSKGDVNPIPVKPNTVGMTFWRVIQ